MQQSIYKAATLTFEDLAFLLPLDGEVIETPPESDLKSVAVNFVGPISGKVVVTVSRGVLPALAVNMLGEDEEDEAMQLDALRECANVICGNVLPNLTNKTDVYKLAAPVEVPVPTDFEESHSSARARFAFDEGFGEVLIVLDRSVR